jgi:hypothetical protein
MLGEVETGQIGRRAVVVVVAVVVIVSLARRG